MGTGSKCRSSRCAAMARRCCTSLSGNILRRHGGISARPSTHPIHSGSAEATVMLRAAIALVPNRLERGKRTLVVAEIGNFGGAELADDSVEVSVEALALKESELLQYPRWSASALDLVSRVITQALHGHEQLPAQRTPVGDLVPVHDDCVTFPYARNRHIPAPARFVFCKPLKGLGTSPLSRRHSTAHIRPWWKARASAHTQQIGSSFCKETG